jgi:hypothetical protein
MTADERILFHRELTPQPLIRKFGNPKWEISTSEKPIFAFESEPEPKILLGKACDPQVEHQLGQHEFGHYIHFKSGLITKGKTHPMFEQLQQKLKLKIPISGIDFVQTAYNWGVELNQPLENEQFGCFFDLVGALTRGGHGGGHKKSYYTEGNNAAMEVFAHGYTTAVCGNPYITKHFPELPLWIRHNLKLPNLGKWHEKHAQTLLYQLKHKAAYPTRQQENIEF